MIEIFKLNTPRKGICKCSKHPAKRTSSRMIYIHQSSWVMQTGLSREKVLDPSTVGTVPCTACFPLSSSICSHFLHALERLRSECWFPPGCAIGQSCVSMFEAGLCSQRHWLWALRKGRGSLCALPCSQCLRAAHTYSRHSHNDGVLTHQMPLNQSTDIKQPN